jgi:hypothetical protein
MWRVLGEGSRSRGRGKEARPRSRIEPPTRPLPPTRSPTRPLTRHRARPMQGLMDGGGGPFQPAIVRVGVNAHHSVAAVSLEALIAARLGDGAEGGGSSVRRARRSGAGRGRGGVAGSLGCHAPMRPAAQARLMLPCGPPLIPCRQANVPAHLRDKLRQAIISEASIVFSTLSFAGAFSGARRSRLRPAAGAHVCLLCAAARPACRLPTPQPSPHPTPPHPTPPHPTPPHPTQKVPPCSTAWAATLMSSSSTRPRRRWSRACWSPWSWAASRWGMVLWGRRRVRGGGPSSL